MKTRSSMQVLLVAGYVCCGWLWSQADALAGTPTAGMLNFGQMNGVFTVEDFQVVNGVGQAAGWLTASVTDANGTNQVGMFTNFPVRMPLSGLMSGAVTLDTQDVTMPVLSTNTCVILGVAVGAIDVIVPGLGLDAHVNEISLVVESDRDTTIGNLLCNVLGGGGILGATNLIAGAANSSGSATNPAGSPNNTLSLGQLQGLTSILLGPTGPATSASLAVGPGGSSSQPKTDSTLTLQTLLQRAIATFVPSAPAPAPSRPINRSSQPAKPPVQ